MQAAEKKLNEMNRLADMGHFPVLVNAGATANVLMTISVTWWIEPRLPMPYAPLVWVAVVLSLNLLPVVILRRTLRPDTVYPALRAMDFIRDQHKFSDWVYLAASANMAFWILMSWTLFSIRNSRAALAAMLSVALVATFSPVLLRSLSRTR
jgi:hypothetical protein